MTDIDAAEKRRFLKIVTSSIGDGARFSHRMKTAIEMAPATNRLIVWTEVQPASGASISA